MRRHPTAPVNVARISVATSGTDFTAPEADFAALIPTACFCPGRSRLSRGNCRRFVPVGCPGEPRNDLAFTPVFLFPDLGRARPMFD